MSSGPLVSVVVPVHNGAWHLPDALASVAAQTVADLEVIVVDDGSTDRTSEIVRRRAQRDPRIVAVSQPNRGLPAARNAALERARAPLVAFLDADDVWLPEKLERQADHLSRHPECEACFTYFEEVDDDLAVITPWSRLRELCPFDVVGADMLVERGNLVAGSGSAVMARRSALQEVGGFDEGLTAAEDLDLWYRLALRAPLQAVPEVLVRIRRQAAQMQGDFSRVLEGRIQFLGNVGRLENGHDADIARTVERRLRRQLLRRLLRRGQLRRGAAQALALALAGRARGSA